MGGKGDIRPLEGPNCPPQARLAAPSPAMKEGLSSETPVDHRSQDSFRLRTLILEMTSERSYQ